MKKNYTDVVGNRDNSVDSHPMIERLDLITNAGQRIELLFARPPEETKWVRNKLRERLQLSPAGDSSQHQ